VHGDIQVRFFIFEEDCPTRPPGVPSEVSRNGRIIEVNGIKGAYLCSVAFHTSFHCPGILTFLKQDIDGAEMRPESDISDAFMLQVLLTDDLESLLAPESDEPEFDIKGRIIRRPISNVEESLQATHKWLHNYVCKPVPEAPSGAPKP